MGLLLSRSHLHGENNSPQSAFYIASEPDVLWKFQNFRLLMNWVFRLMFVWSGWPVVKTYLPYFVFSNIRIPFAVGQKSFYFNAFKIPQYLIHEALMLSRFKECPFPRAFVGHLFFIFSWVLQPTQENLKTMLMQNFWGQIRCIMGNVEVAY